MSVKALDLSFQRDYRLLASHFKELHVHSQKFQTKKSLNKPSSLSHQNNLTSPEPKRLQIFSARGFKVFFRPRLLTNLTLTPSRLGLSASNKFCHSVDRNLFKRHVREAFRHSTIKNAGIDFNFVLNVNVKKLSVESRNAFFSSLRQEVIAFFKTLET